MVARTPTLEWKKTETGWVADLSKTQELRIVIAPVPGLNKLVLVTRRAPDEVLGEFAALKEVFDYAKEWVGDA